MTPAPGEERVEEIRAAFNEGPDYVFGPVLADVEFLLAHIDTLTTALAKAESALSMMQDALAASHAENEREGWHQGFCTPACTPGHHASGCYERMLNDMAEKLRDAERALDEWRVGTHADETGHLHRCAQVNKKWGCAKGCAVARAEHAEQRVAAWEAAAKKIRQCNVVSVYESDNRLMRDVIGIARSHFEELMALLTPPPVAPAGDDGHDDDAADDEYFERNPGRA